MGLVPCTSCQAVVSQTTCSSQNRQGRRITRSVESQERLCSGRGSLPLVRGYALSMRLWNNVAHEPDARRISKVAPEGAWRRHYYTPPFSLANQGLPKPLLPAPRIDSMVQFSLLALFLEIAFTIVNAIAPPVSSNRQPQRRSYNQQASAITVRLVDVFCNVCEPLWR